MIKNEFEHFKGAVAKATCKRDARLVVHALHHGAGILSFGAEIVEQKILMAEKISAVSFQESRLAQRARNCM